MAQAYADLLNSALAALKNSGKYDQQYNDYIASLDPQKTAEVGALTDRQNYETGTANTTADKALQESYISRELATKQNPQLLSAQGFTGGRAESSAADIIRAYENSRNNTETQRAASLANIASNYTGLIGTVNSKYAGMYADKKSTIDSQLINDANTSAAQELARQQTEEAAAAQQRQFDAQLAANAAKSAGSGTGTTGFTDSGTSGSVSTDPADPNAYIALGRTPAQAIQDANNYRYANGIALHSGGAGAQG